MREVSKMSFPLVGNPSGEQDFTIITKVGKERFRTSRNDATGRIFTPKQSLEEFF